MYLLNEEKGLTWAKTCSRWSDLVNFSGLRWWNRRESKREIESKIRAHAWDQYRRRIETEVRATTRLFMTLNEGKGVIEESPYLYFNSHRRQEIMDIFRLRAGFNTTSYSQNLRHLMQSTKCEKCNWINEDEMHLLNDCFLYEDDRANLLLGLEENGVLEGVIRKRFMLHEVVLYAEKFVIWMKEEHAGRFGDVDNEIKNFIYRVMKKKERNAAKQR
ncbi:unnamed protein product [Blepharisma stoltei]|uniref:Reverse transcriptase zinc-binding domain-containing protein n=1 Tax=Blepharisma stoltei TaxID=1481888 RepID=A0AAU9JMD3_9CILI|nr:unnamed protein product [Blepharisma stoltei]